MLGWSMPDGEEKFSLPAMIEQFDVSRISLGAPVFDVDKLKWLNGRWLREELDDDGFADRISEWAYNRENLKKIIPLIKERVDVFSEVADMIAFFAAGLPDITETDLEIKNQSADETKKILQFALWDLETVTLWQKEPLQALFEQLAENLGLKIRDVLAPMFIVLSGKPVSPPLFDSMVIIGPDMTRARIKHGIDVLGGVSKKQNKKLEKEYQTLRRNRP
jgi:glutamyl-tRNA synthetase